MGQVPASADDSTQVESTSSLTQRPTLTFSMPTLDMATHMRPLYITAEVQGKLINKVMVDTGAAVNVVTTRTMGLLDIPRSMILLNSEELHRAGVQNPRLAVSTGQGRAGITGLHLFCRRVRFLLQYDSRPRLDPQKFLRAFLNAPRTHDLGYREP